MSLFHRLFRSPGPGQDLAGLASRTDRKRYSRAAKLFKKAAFDRAREELDLIEVHTALVEFLRAETYKALADSVGTGSPAWADLAETCITTYWNAVRQSRTAAAGEPKLNQEEQEKATQAVRALALATQGNSGLPGEDSRKAIYAEFAEQEDSEFLEGLRPNPSWFGAISVAPILGSVMESGQKARANAIRGITSRHAISKAMLIAIELEGLQHRWTRRPSGQ